MVRTEATSATWSLRSGSARAGLRRSFSEVSAEGRDLFQRPVILSSSDRPRKPWQLPARGVQQEALMSNRATLLASYQHGHHASVVADHAKQTAESAASFFLAFLEPGMRLLDIGCGPGSITSGLAQRVAPADTIGIDPSPSVIETARSLAG